MRKRNLYLDPAWVDIASHYGFEIFALKTIGLAAISAVLKLRELDALLGQTKES
jgi:hypothetical protein